MMRVRHVLVTLLIFTLVLPAPRASAIESDPDIIPDSSIAIENVEALSTSPTIEDESTVEPEQPALLSALEVSQPSSTAPQLAPAEYKPIEPVVEVSPSPVQPVISTPAFIMTAFMVGDELEFVEAVNQSSSPVPLSHIRIETTDSLGVHQTITLGDGWMRPKQFITFSKNIEGTERFMENQAATTGDIVSIEIYQRGSRLQSVDVPIKTYGWWAQHKQRSSQTIKQSGQFVIDFKEMKTSVSEPSVMNDAPYRPPADSSGLEISELLTNPKTCGANGTFADGCEDYIKVINPTDRPINLAGYRLRFATHGDSSSITNTFNWHQSTYSPDDELILAPHSFLTVHLRDDLKPLSLSDENRSAWIEDYWGVKQYQSVAINDASHVANQGYSWAYIAVKDTWEWAEPMPSVFENLVRAVTLSPPEPPKELVACGPDQYRSVETNRCRALAQSSVRIACKDGQYRSELTGRCRSIALAATTLKPCADDQFRSLSTNRCRKIAAAEDVLKECAIGYERNPQTNRCKKIQLSTPPTSAYAPQKVVYTKASIWGWWVLGGASILALGFAGWQWRWEATQAMKRIRQSLTNSKK